MNLESFTGPGSTPSRRRFWDKVTQVVIASQKIEGRNVSVDEHQGMGTIINVPDRTRRPSGGCPSITFADVEFCCYNNGTDSSRAVEPPNLNGTTFATTPVVLFCEDDLTCKNDFTQEIGFNTYSGTTCSDDPTGEFTFPIEVYIGFISGTWHILAGNFSTLGAIFFYGTTGSLATPATNEVTCVSFGTTEWDNALVECVFGGSQLWFNVAENGTATFS